MNRASWIILAISIVIVTASIAYASMQRILLISSDEMAISATNPLYVQGV